jgi:hypothetical protein
VRSPQPSSESPPPLTGRRRRIAHLGPLRCTAARRFLFFLGFFICFSDKAFGRLAAQIRDRCVNEFGKSRHVKSRGSCATTSGRREARDKRGHQETDRSGQFNLALGPRPPFRVLDANSFRDAEIGNGDPGEMLQTSANQCNDSTLGAIAEDSRKVTRLRKSRSGSVVRGFRVGLSLPRAWAFLARRHLLEWWSEVTWILYQRCEVRSRRSRHR